MDGHRWSSTADMYDAFAQVLSYDPSYGRGPDAFDDALSDVAAYTFGADPAATGTVVAVTGFDTLLRLDRRIAQLTLDSFARQARLAGLYGHPMLCLVHTSATDLGRVGGTVSFPRLPGDFRTRFDRRNRGRTSSWERGSIHRSCVSVRSGCIGSRIRSRCSAGWPSS
ncbi:barstar family protein (plasmid) [Rhodococcus aetherivorans]|uniref:barstar family protein n=1 Tax=Rhodococcus aetherivorans TaxID=191292 RepID=UPI003EBD681E